MIRMIQRYVLVRKVEDLTVMKRIRLMDCSFWNSGTEKCEKKAIYELEKFYLWNGKPIRFFGESDRENTNYNFMLACEKHSKAYKAFSAPIILVKKRTKIKD